MEKLSGKTQRKNWEVKLDRKTSVEKLVKNLNILKKLRTRISQSTQGPTAQLYNSVQKRFQNNLFRAGMFNCTRSIAAKKTFLDIQK